MMRTAISTWVVATLVMASALGCSVVDVTQAGPRITATLENGSDQTRSDSTTPSLRLGSSGTTYSIVVTVASEDGREDNATDVVAHPVASLTATFTVPGTPIGDSAFDATATYGGDDFVRREPIVLPASAKGQVLAVHAVAEDDDGLSSNVLDFDVALE